MIFVYFTNHICQNYKKMRFFFHKVYLIHSFQLWFIQLTNVVFNLDYTWQKALRRSRILKTFYKFGGSNYLISTFLLTFLKKKTGIKSFPVNAWNPVTASFKSFSSYDSFNHPSFWFKP